MLCLKKWLVEKRKLVVYFKCQFEKYLVLRFIEKVWITRLRGSNTSRLPI